MYFELCKDFYVVIKMIQIAPSIVLINFFMTLSAFMEVDGKYF